MRKEPLPARRQVVLQAIPCNSCCLVHSDKGRERITSRHRRDRHRPRIVGKLPPLIVEETNGTAGVVNNRGVLPVCHRQALHAQRTEPSPLDTEAFALFVKREIDKWSKVVSATGMTVE